MRVDGGIDKAQTVRSTRSPVEAQALAGNGSGVVVNVGTVQESSVESGRAAGFGSLPQLVDSLVVPVVEKDEANILIVVCRRRAVDENATKQTLPGLQTVVRVVPGESIELSETELVKDLPARAVLGQTELIRHAAPDCNGALRNRHHTIIRVGKVLAHAVEVDARAICALGQVVGEVNPDSVSPISVDGGTGYAAVDGLDIAFDSIRGCGTVLKDKPVLASNASIWNGLVVVGRNIVVTPGGSRRGVIP